MSPVQYGEAQHDQGCSGSAYDEVMVTLSQAVKAGELEGLEALRDTLAAEIEAGPQEKQSSQTAALARQLRDVLTRIAELERAKPKGSIVDDLGAKRAARIAATPSAGKAVGGGRK